MITNISIEAGGLFPPAVQTRSEVRLEFSNNLRNPLLCYVLHKFLLVYPHHHLYNEDHPIIPPLISGHPNKEATDSNPSGSDRTRFMEEEKVSVLVVDDHPIVRAGMRLILEDAPGIKIIGEGTCGQDALRMAVDLHPKVLVLDINLPDISGLEVTRRLSSIGSKTAILILTVLNDDRTVFGLLEAGASGYVLKEDALETLANAIKAAARGETWLSSKVTEHVVHRALEVATPMPKSTCDLTTREMEVLLLLAEGLSNEAIAHRLTLTLRTVQNHVSAIYGKLGVDSRTEAVLYAIRHGWASISQGKDSPSGS